VLQAAKVIYGGFDNWRVKGIRDLQIGTPEGGLTVEVVILNTDTREVLRIEGVWDGEEWSGKILATELDSDRADAAKKGKGKGRAKPKCTKGQPCGGSCISRAKNCRIKPEGAVKEALNRAAGSGPSGGGVAAASSLKFGKYDSQAISDLRDKWIGDFQKNLFSPDKNVSNQAEVARAILADPGKDKALRTIRDTAGNLQSAAIVRESVNRIPTKNDHLQVEWLATATWNLPGSTDSRKVRGAGSAMIRGLAEEVRANIDKYPGGIQLSALQAAIPFYEKLGFTKQLELNSVAYMVLSADKIKGGI
jgi:hypothetical protein